jgi:CBS domain-containing protein/hemerythrin-like domain-containing protein
MTLRSCEHLRREHRLITEVMGRVEGLLRAGNPEAIPPQLVTGAVDFFMGFVAGCHEAKEEEAFFPALDARGAAGHEVLESLRDDHREGRRLLAVLRGRPSRAPLAAGSSSVLQAYLAVLRRHLANEEGILLPLAERLLSEEDDAAVERAFVGIEDRELRIDGNEAVVTLASALARAAEILATAPRGAAGPLLAREVMRPRSATAAPDDTLARAAETMQRLGTREVAVVRDGALVGILARSDMEPYRGHYEWTLVRAAMTVEPLTVSAETPVEAVAELLLRRGFNAVPVTEGQNLLGMISRSDVLRAVART